MRKRNIIIIVTSFLLFTFLGILYILFKGGTWFLSSFDGNNANSNYTSIVKEYYLFKTEKTICLYSENGYSRITATIDSLNWNNDIIAGYSKTKYFRINIATQEINYFDCKDALLKAIHVMPIETLREIPSIK